MYDQLAPDVPQKKIIGPNKKLDTNNDSDKDSN